jgi:hypothetical protein
LVALADVRPQHAGGPKGKGKMGAMTRQTAADIAGPLRALCMALALFYLAGPLIIMAELLNPVYWVPALLLFLAWLAELDSFLFPKLATMPAGKPPTRRRLDLRRLAAQALLLALCAAWIFSSGIGSFTICRYDYIKHNLLFSSLLSGHLPIEVNFREGSTSIIHYYFAYYILPVRVYQGLHALFGPLRLDHVVFLTYCLALFASLRVMAASVKVSAFALLALFAFGGGLDVAGHLLFGVAFAPVGQVPGIGLPFYRDLDWWGVPMAPQSLTMNLFWAPQHFFAAVIGTALITCIFRLERPAGAKLLHAFCIVAASTLWSPYVAVGLAVVSLGETLGPARRDVIRWAREARWGVALTPRFCAAAVFTFLLLAFVAVFYAAAAATSPPSLIFSKLPVGDLGLSFLLREAPAFVVLAVLLAHRLFRGPGRTGGLSAGKDSGLIWVFAFLLGADALLLCFAHGVYDDWGMRTTLPFSVLIAAALCRFLKDWAGRAAKTVVILLLALTSLSSVNELAQSLFRPWGCAPYGAFAWHDLGVFTGQYLARRDSLLYGRLARAP